MSRLEKRNEKRVQILSCIQEERIYSQKALLEALDRRGVRLTQPSLSRYLRELDIHKHRPREGGYYFVAGGKQRSKTDAQGLWQSLAPLVKSIHLAGNLVIIQTNAAAAPPIAALVDDKAFRQNLGTLAGDDTIFLATAGLAEANELRMELRTLFGLERGETHA